MPFFAVLLLSCDTYSQPESPQRILLQNFLGGLQNSQRYRPSEEHECKWFGISCKKGCIVNYVEYRQLNIGNFDISSLPPTVTRAIFVTCNQEFVLCTRVLPRLLQHLNMCVNRLFGIIDLANLPLGSEEILLSDNRLSGPVLLIDLPKGLKVLNLSGNDLVGKPIYYGKLPEGIEKILLKPTYRTRASVRPLSQSVRLSKERLGTVFPFSVHS